MPPQRGTRGNDRNDPWGDYIANERGKGSASDISRAFENENDDDTRDEQ